MSSLGNKLAKRALKSIDVGPPLKSALSKVVVICLGLAAFGFLVAAGYQALGQLWAPPVPALVVALVFAGMAFCVWVGGKLASHRRQKASKSEPDEALLTLAGYLVGALVGDPDHRARAPTPPRDGD